MKDFWAGSGTASSCRVLHDRSDRCFLVVVLVKEGLCVISAMIQMLLALSSKEAKSGQVESQLGEFMPFTNYPLQLLSGGRIFDANSFVPLPLAIIASGKCGGAPASSGPTIKDVCNVSRFLTPSLLYLI